VKTQDQTLELLAELILFGEQLQHSFLGLWRIENEICPLPTKTAPVTFPSTGATKHTVPECKWKRPRLALKLEVVDADRFRSQRQIAELLIRGV